MTLGVNAQKSVAILLGQYQTHNTHINIKGHQITWLNQAKYLGVYFDRMLSFKSHITNLATKANKIYELLYSVLNTKSPLSLKSKINIHQIYIRSVVTYADEATFTLNWSNLESTQNITLRTIKTNNINQLISSTTIIDVLSSFIIENNI